MPVPTRFLIDALRKLRGDAYVTHPDSVLGVRRVERVFTVPRGTDEKNYLIADGQYADTVLVEQHTVGGDQQYVEIYQAYENLPSSWVPFTRYDDNLGPIQGKMRAVVNTGQVSVLGPTSKSTYQGRNGSALVLIETQENWTDGSGGENNPEFPIISTDDYDKARGPFNIETQVIVATGHEVGSLVVAGGVANYIHYEPLPGYAPVLLKMIDESWAVPGVQVPSESVNEDGTTTVTTKQMALASAIVEGETIGGGFWTKISSEDYSDTIRWKVTAVRPLPGNAMVKTSITPDGDIMTETRTLVQLSTVTTTTVVSGGIWTRTFEEPVSAIVAQKVVQERKTQQAMPSYSIEIPDPVPLKFRIAVPVTTTETTEIGTASMPTLGTGELSRTETQIDQYTFKRRITSRAALTLPITLTDTRVTDDGQVATQTETLAAGIQTVTPHSDGTTVSSVVENLGNNTSVKTEVTVTSLFTKATFETEIPDVIPKEFAALLNTRETVAISAGTASQPTLATGEYDVKDEQLTVQLKRTRRKSRDLASLPITLTGKKVLADGRQATITKKLDAGVQTITVTARTEEALVDVLGDGNSVRTQIEADEALPQTDTRNEQPVLPPPRKFLTITSDQTVESVVESQTVTPDALGTSGVGVVEASAKQIEKFKGVKRTRTRAGSAASSVTEYGLNQDGVLVTRVTNYGTDGSAPTPAINTEAINIEALGDGKFSRMIASIPASPGFLDKPVFEAEVPDFMPARFLNTASPAATVVHILQGTASTPSLNPGAGELLRREEQLDAFKFRRTVKTRLNTGFPTPGLDGHGFDEQFGILTPYVESIVTASTHATDPNSEVTPLNDNFSLLKVYDVSAQQAALAAFTPLIFPGQTNVDIPTELKSVSQYASDAGATDAVYQDVTSYDLSGRGSGSLQCHGSAAASAVQMAEVDYGLKEIRGSNVPCHHILFFRASGTTRAAILSYLSGVGLGTVNDWPAFAPRAEGIICKGARLAAKQTVNGHFVSSAISKYDGTIVGGVGTAVVTGSGNEYDRSLTTKVVRLPPTIHPALSLLNSITGISFAVQASITGTFIVIPGGIVGNATASVNAPTINTATPGPTSGAADATRLPTSGIYLARLNAEPYKFGYIKYHAELVKFGADAIVSIN